MNITQLKTKLCRYGKPEIVKEGDVFTVLITGANLSNFDNMNAIQKAIIDYAGERYPIIECMKNDKDFFCLILKPRNDSSSRKISDSLMLFNNELSRYADRLPDNVKIMWNELLENSRNK